MSVLLYLFTGHFGGNLEEFAAILHRNHANPTVQPPLGGSPVIPLLHGPGAAGKSLNPPGLPVKVTALCHLLGGIMQEPHAQ
jgi:hypothetical protein